VIVARVDGDVSIAASAVRAVGDVQGVETHGNELVVTTDNGSATISPVAVALASCGVTVRDLTLRTPTLDDVFLDLTGSHIETGDAQ
jgi:ABC-2 type transport system ATP-binding protein